MRACVEWQCIVSIHEKEVFTISRYKKPKDDLKEAVPGSISDKIDGQQIVPEVDDFTKIPLKKRGNPKNAVEQKETPKQVYNTATAATTALTGSLAPAGRAMMVLPASGNSGGNGLSGDRSGFNAQGSPDRPDTRTGKKTNSTARSIRSIVSEQFESGYKTSKPLSQAADQVQGANGQPYNPHYHSQKVHGANPLGFEFERSLDFITRDEILYDSRQYVTYTGLELGDALPLDANRRVLPANNTADIDYEIVRGSFLPRALTITITPDMDVSFSYVGEEDLTAVTDNHEVLDRASQAAITQANLIEVERQIIESKAGADDQPGWSPLPLAVENPVGILGLFKDLDNAVGSEMLLAIKKTELATAFAINRTAKDGLNDRILPELFRAGMVYRNRSQAYEHMDWEGRGANQNGSVSWLIALNDSLNKYRYKSDIILQPRGIKMIIDTARQNLSPFKVDKDFADLFHNREVFSTIGESYDAFKPIYLTDGEVVTHARPLSDFIDANGKPSPVTYTYRNNRTQTIQGVIHHPIIQGLYEFLRYNASKIRSLFPNRDDDGDIDVVINVPIFHATTRYSLWSALLMAATPEIMRARMYSFRDLNELARNHGYPFDKLVDLQTAMDMQFRNFGFNGIDEPLSARTLDSVHAISWVMPELVSHHLGINTNNKSGTSTGTQVSGYLMPWYMSSRNFTNTGALLADTYIMAMPNVRSGTVSTVLDSVHASSERELRLMLDIMVDIPRFTGGANTFTDLHEFKFDAKDSGLAFVSVRNSNASAYAVMTNLQLLKTPRELGLSQVAPINFVIINEDPDDTATHVAGRDTIMTRATGATPFRGAYSYVSYVYNIDGQPSANYNEMNAPENDPSTGLSQEYIRCAVSELGIQVLQGLGLPLSSSAMIMSAAYTPATGDNVLQNRYMVDNPTNRYVFVKTDGDEPSMSAAEGQRGGLIQNTVAHFRFVDHFLPLWTRIQRTHFVVSPWDAIPLTKVWDVNANMALADGNSYKQGFTVNPYDYAGVFGLAGFSESDYSEDVYNRSSRKVVEGMGYVSDLFIEDSLLTK